ncbi:MAG: ABC transporter substrate-binding protein [Nitrospinota bacterium]
MKTPRGRRILRLLNGLGFFVAAALIFLGPAIAQAAGKSVIRLSWKVKGEYAPLYVALDKGYYKAEGLNVAVEPGSGASVAIKLIATGKDQFAYIGGLETAQGVGKDIPIRMVANFVKKLPVGVAAHPHIQLKTPKDLEGKKLAVAPVDSFVAILPAFARAHKLDLAKINVIKLGWGSRVPAFMRGETELITIYFTNDLPVMEAKMGKKLNTLASFDWGFKLLGHGLVVSNDYLAANGDTIRKVLRASAKGWADTLKNPREAAEIIAKRFQTLKVDITERQLIINNGLTRSPATKGKPLGWQAAEDWKETLDTLQKTGGIAKRKELKAYYTNEFVGGASM